MQDARTCTHCSGELAPGFLEDTAEGGSKVLRWIPGPIEKGIFGGAKVAFKDRYDVEAYVCTQCSRLELFLA